MITLTIQGKDNTKQINNMQNNVILDAKNKPMTPEKQDERITEIAMTIGGQNYKNHKIEIM